MKVRGPKILYSERRKNAVLVPVKDKAARCEIMRVL